MPEQHLQTLNSLLGIDFGTRHLGLAIGQTITLSANPLPTINAQPPQLWDELDKVMHEWQPDAIVLGLPLNMDDTDSKLTPHVKAFARKCQERYHILVFLMDERLSSFEAKMQMKEKGSYLHKNRDKIHGISAKIILESWFQEHQ